jgi:hypothetical protein
MSPPELMELSPPGLLPLSLNCKRRLKVNPFPTPREVANKKEGRILRLQSRHILLTNEIHSKYLKLDRPVSRFLCGEKLVGDHSQKVKRTHQCPPEELILLRSSAFYLMKSVSRS